MAARRVVPPLLIAPAARSPTRRKLIKPDDGAAAGKRFAFAAQIGEVRAGARAIFEEARLADPEIHDAAFADEVVVDRLDEAGMALGVRV